MRGEARRRLLGILLLVTATALGLALLDVRLILARLPPEWRPPSQRGFVWHYENNMFPDTTPPEMGDGGPASRVRFQDPMGIGEDAVGRLYVSDRGHLVWRIDPDGRAHVVAGTGRQGEVPTGIPALESDLGIPEGLCLDGLDRVHFADSRNNVVLRIEIDGLLTRIAGTGERGFGGDGGPAREALLNRPFDVRFDAAGNLYVADYGNHRIRRVLPDGTIATLAGTGEAGYSGDGGPASAARLNEPYGTFPDGEGGLLIADSGNHVIRRVDPHGIISTFAGRGVPGYAGDGGPALQALFNWPQALFVTDDGRIYVNDEHNHAIRVIGTGGTVSTLIGDGTPDAGSDGTEGWNRLSDPENLIEREDGAVLVTEGDARRVRAIASGRVFSYAGSPPSGDQ